MHHLVGFVIENNDINTLTRLIRDVPYDYACDENFQALKSFLGDKGAIGIMLNDGGGYKQWVASILQGDNVDTYQERFLDVPFAIACEMGRLESAKALLALGANPRFANDEALRFSSMNDEIDSVKYLISLGCDPNAANCEAFCLARSDEMKRLLMAHGANPRQ